MTTKQITTKAEAIVRRMNIGQLCNSMLAVEEIRLNCERGSDDWQAVTTMFVWLTEEIERRYDVEDAMNAWADEDTNGMTYGQALIAALPADIF
jgi:hypothetical protein